MTANKRHNCPFCPALGLRNDDLAFSVSWEKGKYHCFRCGTSGGVSSLPPNFKQPLILEKDKKSHEQLDVGTLTSLRDSSRGKAYLEGRGLDSLPLEDFVFVSKKNLVFPIYGTCGDIVYYVSRKMWGGGRRYDNAGFTISHLFVPYGADLPCRRTFVITEGVMDALSIYQWLKVDCIALLGMNINDFKVRKILEYTYPETRLIILLDSGEYQMSQEYFRELKPLRKNTTICKLDEGDPNSIGKEKLWGIMRQNRIPVGGEADVNI